MWQGMLQVYAAQALDFIMNKEVYAMNSQVKIPGGDELITVELTLKEAIALSGIRFHDEPHLVLDARKKLKRRVKDAQIEADVH